MVAVTDKVVLELEAKLDRYRAEIATTVTETDRRLAQMEASMVRAERTSQRTFNAVGQNANVAGAASAAAAIAVAALVGAFLQARAAAEFADNLQDAARAAHISTDALQGYQYALVRTGGEIEGASRGLLSFSTALGRAQQGLVAAQRPFQALGFTAEQVRSFQSVEQALDAILPRIADLRNSSQRDAIIQQLGLRDLAPLLDEMGIRGTGALRDILGEAERVGFTMDRYLIRKGAEANDQIELLSRRVGNELQTAFLSLAPALITILTLLNAHLQVVNRIIDRMQSIPNQSDRFQRQNIARLEAEIAANNANPTQYNQNTVNPRLQRELDERRLVRLNRFVEEQGENTEQALRNTGRTDLIPPPSRTRTRRPRQGPNRALQAANAERRTQEEIYRAQLRRLQALSDLLQPLEAQQTLQGEIVTAQRAHRDAEIQQQVEAYRLSRGASGISAAQARRVVAANGLADAAEDRLTAERQSLAIAERDLEFDRRFFDSHVGLLNAQADLARTTVERVAIQQRILRLERNREIEEMRARHQSDPLYQGPRGQELAGRERAESAEAFGLRQRAVLEPLLDEWRTGILGAFEALRSGGPEGVLSYLADRFTQRILGNLVDSLANLMLSASPQGGGGGGVGGLIASGFSYLFGGKRAFGGQMVAGASYLINDGQPEVFRPGVSGAMQPLGAMQGGGRGVQNINHSYDLRGAVVTNEIWAKIEASEARAKQHADRGDRSLSKAVPMIVATRQHQRGRG